MLKKPPGLPAAWHSTPACDDDSPLQATPLTMTHREPPCEPIHMTTLLYTTTLHYDYDNHFT